MDLFDDCAVLWSRLLQAAMMVCGQLVPLVDLCAARQQQKEGYQPMEAGRHQLQLGRTGDRIAPE